MHVAVLTVDQRSSRHTPDRLPETIDDLKSVPTLLGFERTVGDEFQGVLVDPAAVGAAVERLLRDGGWSVGLGVGAIELPLPERARAGRGPAYVLAREAVTAAKTSPWHLRVAAADRQGARLLESVVWLWAALLSRRTPRGWEVADLVDRGVTHQEAADLLGVSQSAVTQRATAARVIEGQRGRDAVADLVAQLLGAGGTTP